MRAALVSSLIVLLACGGGGAQKPAETSSADPPESTSSGSTASEDMPASASTSDSTPAPAPKPAATAAPAPVDAPPAAFHPTPSVTGAIDGKPFNPKIARLLSPLMADGRVALTLTEGTTCDVTPGDPTMTITVTWKKGYKTDLASLKRASKKSVNEIGFARAAGKFSTTFKPTGTVQVVSAPTAKDATGKMKLDVTAGEYILAGDIDVLVCTSP
jgi:hypothetical protein